MHIDWRFVLNLSLVASLVTAFLTWWLTSLREHRRWVLDNKKLEWRELIDKLHACMCNMVYAFHQETRTFERGGEGDVDFAIQSGFRVIHDRIFIADAIQQHLVLIQWKELAAYVTTAGCPREPEQHGAPTTTGFETLGSAFENKLLATAREDLRLGKALCINIRQGIFRLWIVSSVLFVIGVGAISYGSISEEFRVANTDWDAEAAKYGGWSLLPADCTKARGTAGIDYDASQKDGLCWYKTEDFRRLYPEYKDVSNSDLSEKLYAKAGRPLEHIHPWHKVMQTAGFAFGVPLAVLALGWSLLWAIAGFRGSGPN